MAEVVVVCFVVFIVHSIRPSASSTESRPKFAGAQRNAIASEPLAVASSESDPRSEELTPLVSLSSDDTLK